VCSNVPVPVDVVVLPVMEKYIVDTYSIQGAVVVGDNRDFLKVTMASEFNFTAFGADLERRFNATIVVDEDGALKIYEGDRARSWGWITLAVAVLGGGASLGVAMLPAIQARLHPHDL
jgi:hypothetical protein